MRMFVILAAASLAGVYLIFRKQIKDHGRNINAFDETALHDARSFTVVFLLSVATIIIELVIRAVTWGVE